ncbi:MAG TPA: PEP/pyruvate-binding domain-containing protein, partial [Dissulfurispiraceae bacterium]|nr:PEP/pyruvate-binding domain-containing protein [Dissulfurispiraceae bacterium]
MADDDNIAAASLPLKTRFEAFRRLLDNNNAALTTMADLGEKLSGEYLFDRTYVTSKTREAAEHVGAMITNLNIVCNKRYEGLHDCHTRIAGELNDIIGHKETIADDVYTVSLDALSSRDAARVGGKMANLGELHSQVGLPVPNGFAITAYAYRRFLETNHLPDKITEYLERLESGDLAALEAASASIQEIVKSSPVPDDLAEEIKKAYIQICSSSSASLPVSVRSSALQEDGDFSFAGQYSTFLNVTSTDIISRYKDVLASLFNQRALFYWKSKGFQQFDMVMPVGILAMVNARAGGVMYSRDPNNPADEAVLISAAHGLGLPVVDGTVSPETYFVSRNGGKVARNAPQTLQQHMIVCTEADGIEQRPLDGAIAAIPCLTDDQARLLAGYAQKLEAHYGCPQDIEWALDAAGTPILLQSRPLRVFVREQARPVPTHVPGYDIVLSRGSIACKGIGFGPVHFVRLDEDLQTFPSGGVLLAKHTSTKFVTVMDRAAAIITDVGSTTGHMASLAREYQIPTILDTAEATRKLQQGQLVTVDAVNCNVYAGTVEELREFAERKDDPIKGTQLFLTLEKAMKLITPLNLIDPQSPDFSPSSCRTLHDITRFSHEMAVRELFDIENIFADNVGA